MGHEQGLGGHGFRGGSILASRFCNQVGEDRLDVFHVQAGAMKSRVGKPAGEQLPDGDNAPLLSHVGPLQDHPDRAHAHDHPVATAVEGQSCILYLARRGGRTGGQKAGPHPLQEVV